MIILTVILTFIAASFVMYDKFNSTMKKGIRDEAEYVKVGIEEVGEEYLNGNVGKTTDTRITLTDSEGNVLYDNEAEASKLPNHSSRPAVSYTHLHSLSIMLHCIGDFERISDHALSIMKSAKEISEKNARFSDKAVHCLLYTSTPAAIARAASFL